MLNIKFHSQILNVFYQIVFIILQLCLKNATVYEIFYLRSNMLNMFIIVCVVVTAI